MPGLFRKHLCAAGTASVLAVAAAPANQYRRDYCQRGDAGLYQLAREWRLLLADVYALWLLGQNLG